MVDTTWTCVNKDGGPDRRFNNNRPLPVVSPAWSPTTAAGLLLDHPDLRYQAARPVARALPRQFRIEVRRPGQAESGPRVSRNVRKDRRTRRRAKRTIPQGHAKGIYSEYPPAPLADTTGDSKTAPRRNWNWCPEREARGCGGPARGDRVMIPSRHPSGRARYPMVGVFYRLLPSGMSRSSAVLRLTSAASRHRLRTSRPPYRRRSRRLIRLSTAPMESFISLPMRGLSGDLRGCAAGSPTG